MTGYDRQAAARRFRADVVAKYGTIAEFCRATGMDRGRVSSWVNGTKAPNLDARKVLRGVFDQDHFARVQS